MLLSYLCIYPAEEIQPPFQNTLHAGDSDTQRCLQAVSRNASILT